MLRQRLTQSSHHALLSCHVFLSRRDCCCHSKLIQKVEYAILWHDNKPHRSPALRRPQNVHTNAQAQQGSRHQMHQGEVVGTPQPMLKPTGRPTVSVVTVLILLQVMPFHITAAHRILAVALRCILPAMQPLCLTRCLF